MSRLSSALHTAAFGTPVKTRHREKKEDPIPTGEGYVVLYINGREYTRKVYSSKKQRTAYVGRWFEEFGCSIEIGIIPNTTPKQRN